MTPSSPKGEGTNPRSWPVKAATSYGGVVVRDGLDGPAVALIRPRNPNKEVWALPKGAKEEGEDLSAAALREVKEETGLDAEIVESLEPFTYWYAWAPEKVRYKKTVHFFLMRHTGGEARPDGFEVEDVRFFPIADAVRKASYTSERKILEQAAEILAATRPGASPRS